MTTNAQSLSVTTWDDFVGQTAMKERLTVHIEAARADCRPLEHVLLVGPFGSGKTSLARLIAQQVHDPLLELTMPMDERSLLAAFDGFAGGILFLDEVHTLGKSQQDTLLSLLAEGYLQDRRGVRHPKSWLTVIAATTERDKVQKALYSRFQIAPEFENYSDDELSEVVRRMALQIKVELPEGVATVLGHASGGRPRNAESLVLAARALQTTGREVTAESVLDLCNIDPDGLTELHRRLLDVLAGQKNRASQRTIAMMLQVPPDAVPDLERLPLELGLLVYTPSGRELTPQGIARQQGYEAQEYERR